jgi:hypothetical protein
LRQARAFFWPAHDAAWFCYSWRASTARSAAAQPGLNWRDLGQHYDQKTAEKRRMVVPGVDEPGFIQMRRAVISLILARWPFSNKDRNDMARARKNKRGQNRVEL